MTDGAIACKSCPWPAHVQPFATPNTVETRKESAKLFLSGTHNHRRFSSWGARRRGCYTRHMFTRTQVLTEKKKKEEREVWNDTFKTWTCHRPTQDPWSWRMPQEKSPGFRPLAPPVVRWANFVSEGKLPRPVENSDKQNDIDEDEMTQACDDYRLRKAADPAWFELQRRARSAFRSAQWCLHNAFFLQRGPASNAWSQRGSHKFYKTYKKEKVNTLALMMRCPLSHMTASQTPEANRKRAQRTSEGGSVPPFFFLRVWETTECNNIIALSVFLIRNHQGNTV